MKKKVLLVLGIVLLSLVGCQESNKTSIISNNEKINTSKMEHKHCSRTATASSDIEVSLNYDIYYTGDILNIVHSEEIVTSSKKENLDLYEDSYRKISEYYKDLDYYDFEVKRDENSTGAIITINYDKVDIGKLLDLEGEEDNIIENGKAKVDKWMELAKKFGTSCTDVEEK
ncbi:MAG: DUF1307 domain-containing protein [Bacilli bacterium]|nr:DUF1307 domain-containing protein [Bacilli bacterium]